MPPHASAAARDCARPLLSQLQELIRGIYDLPAVPDVCDFLVTDRRSLPPAAAGGVGEEELIVAQEEDTLALSLYLDPGLLERLAQANPLDRLHGRNVADYCTVLEGVSHFVCVAFHAGYDRPVSLLELELQAEIDKYAASVWLLRRQRPQHFPAELPRLLFERSRVDERLARGRAAIYRSANRYALKYCRALERTLRRFGAGESGWLTELRRFYRLGGGRKQALIEQYGA